jgi:hypothetical protein
MPADSSSIACNSDLARHCILGLRQLRAQFQPHAVPLLRVQRLDQLLVGDLGRFRKQQLVVIALHLRQRDPVFDRRLLHQQRLDLGFDLGVGLEGHDLRPHQLRGDGRHLHAAIGFAEDPDRLRDDLGRQSRHDQGGRALGNPDLDAAGDLGPVRIDDDIADRRERREFGGAELRRRQEQNDGRSRQERALSRLSPGICRQRRRRTARRRRFRRQEALRMFAGGMPSAGHRRREYSGDPK